MTAQPAILDGALEHVENPLMRQGQALLMLG